VEREGKMGEWEVSLPRVLSQGEAEVLKVTLPTGRRKMKRTVTKVCFVEDSCTRKLLKYERFIRPMDLHFKVHIIHPELKVTFVACQYLV
jgi:ribosome biogenesis protein NSA2